MVFHRGVKTGSRGNPAVFSYLLYLARLSLVDAPAITVVPRGDAELKGTGSWPSLHPFRRLADTFPEMAEPKRKPGPSRDRAFMGACIGGDDADAANLKLPLSFVGSSHAI